MIGDFLLLRAYVRRKLEFFSKILVYSRRAPAASLQYISPKNPNKNLAAENRHIARLPAHLVHAVAPDEQLSPDISPCARGLLHYQ